MSKQKSKAGTKSKVKAAKPVAHKAAPPASDPQGTGAHLDAPSGAEHPGAGKSSGVTKAEAKEASKLEPGTVAIVSKGAERIAVRLKDDAHLAKLREEFGDAGVEVQS